VEDAIWNTQPLPCNDLFKMAHSENRIFLDSFIDETHKIIVNFLRVRSSDCCVTLHQCEVFHETFNPLRDLQTILLERLETLEKRGGVKVC